MNDTNQPIDELADVQRQLAHERTARQRAEAALHDRMALEEVLMRISTRFVNLPADQLDQGIHETLAEIGTLAEVSRSYVFRIAHNGTIVINTHEWCAPGVTSVIHEMQALPFASQPWIYEQITCGQVVHVPCIDALPPEATALRQLCIQQQIKALLLVPMIVQGEIIGLLGFDNVHSSKHWSADSITLLRVVGEIIASAWQYQQTDATLQESQRMLTNLMRNLPGMAYRCRLGEHWTMEFVSEGSLALTGYAAADLIANRHIAYGNLIHPDDREHVQQVRTSALEAHQPFEVTYRLITASGEARWVWEQGRKVARAAGEPPVLEGFVTDMSERVAAQRQLEQRVSERTHQLTTLLEISQHVTSTLDMEPLLGVILDQLREVVAYTAASIFVLEDDQLGMLSHRGPITDLAGFRLSLAAAGANREVIRRGEPLIIADVRSDTPLARLFQATAGHELYTTYRYMRSWMGVPLMLKNRIIGMLTLDHATPAAYTADQARVVLAFAQQASVAIENARLYNETRRQAEETATLLAVQQALSSRLDPDGVLQTIADAACRLTGADFGTVLLQQGDNLCVSVLSGHYGPDMVVGYCLPIANSASGQAMRTRHSVHITDCAEESGVYQDAMQRAGLRALLGIPLLSGDEPIGVIAVGHQHARRFSAEDERVLAMLTPGAVLALENARLYRAEQERRQEAERRRQIAEGLHDVLTALNSNLALDKMLATIAAQAQRLLGAAAVAIFRLHDDGMLRVQASTGVPIGYATELAVPIGIGAVGVAIQERHPVAIRQAAAFFAAQIAEYGPIMTPRLRTLMKHIASRYHALLVVPLLVKDERYGAITLYYDAPRQFDDEEIALAQAFADQVALAIESARFSEQAQQAAALEERQRLARDLHDAVTQTLFSASMIADVLPRLWERRPDEAQRRLAELRQLTRGALAEMRTLLLELRPAALHTAHLGDVLQQLCEAATGRARLPIGVTVTGTAQLPAEVRVVFYRIAQEAVQNAIKHARASQIALTLHHQPTTTTLQICDDGRGFVLAQVDGLHFGLRIMHERAAAVRAALHISSKPGHGTTITVTWPIPISSGAQAQAAHP